MKVAIVLNDFQQGGAERFVTDLVSNLETTSGVDPELVVFSNVGNLREDAEALDTSYTSLDVDVSVTGLPRASRELGAFLDAAAVDVVHSHLPFSHLTARVAARSTGLPHVATYHNVREKRTLPKSVIERATWWLSARITCVSGGVADSYGPRPNMEVIPNAIEVEAFKERVADANRPDGLSDVPDDRTVLLNVARCTRVKRQGDLVAAIETLDRDDVHLVVVGDGPRREDLEGAAAAAGLEDEITFTGYVEDIEPYYAAADVFVSASTREGLPTTHLEAMGAELPIVSTEIPGVRELVEEGETGVLVPPRDPQALASAIDRIGEENCELFGERGYERAAEDFSMRSVTREYVDLYSSLHVV